MRRRGMMGATPLPYDAEIEYLETRKNGATVTAFIDTGFLGTEKNSFEIKFVFLGVGQAIFGSRSTNTNAVIVSNTNARMGNKNTLVSLVSNTLYTATLDKDYYVLNNIQYALGASVFTTNNNIHIFNANATNVAPSEAQVYYFKMWEDGNLKLHLIPVRVGTTGYMYDKVSGQLFGNAGAGDFVLGADV